MVRYNHQLLSTLGQTMVTFVATDLDNGVTLMVNKKPYYAALIGPRLPLDLTISSSKAIELFMELQKSRTSLGNMEDTIKQLLLVSKTAEGERLRQRKNDVVNNTNVSKSDDVHYRNKRFVGNGKIHDI